jgi:hypothetical protein
MTGMTGMTGMTVVLSVPSNETGFPHIPTQSSPSLQYNILDQ